jgi:adenylate kinase family enzyme
MKRVVVLGPGGAGKSTFARRLGEITELPVVHLDRLYWKPGWIETAKDEWREIVKREIAKPEWIIDGNFGGTREMRMRAADTIIFLDLPRWLCLYRIVKRRLAHIGRSRPDMGEGCIEKLDPEFIAWVWNYRRQSGQRALEELKTMNDKAIVFLRSTGEVSAFLKDPYAYQTR